MAMVRAGGVFGRALTLAWLAGAPMLSAQGLRNLEPGVHENQLAPGETHAYEIRVASGQFLRLVVEQNHLDVTVRIRSSDGAVLAEVDNAADRGEPLSMSLVATHDGIHRIDLRLRSPMSTAGPYRLVLEPPRPATPADGRRLFAECMRGEADHLLARGTATSLKEALESYGTALAAWQELGDRREEGTTVARMSDASSQLGDPRRGRDDAERSLELWRSVGDRRGEATALQRIGDTHYELGQLRAALAYLEAALELRRAAHDLYGQAEALNTLSVVHSALGEKPEAISRYAEALKFAHAAGWRIAEATILRNRAVDYMLLGESDRALADLLDVLPTFRALDDRVSQGMTFRSIGDIYVDRRDLPEALRNYDSALALMREMGDKRLEGYTLNQMGLAHILAGRPETALRHFELARELLQRAGDRWGEAQVLANTGRALLAKGDTVEARDLLREVLPRMRASGDRMHEAGVLLHLARAERALGDLAAARARIEEALRLTESLRGSIPGSGERTSYMARSRDRYDLLIAILMDLEEKEPGHGWLAEALHASERAKARGLVDLLAEARINLREGVDESLLAEERSLETRLERRRREEAGRLAAGSSPEASDLNRRALDALLAEYRDVEGRLRAADPRFAALTRPEPLALKEIREQVLDGDTLLLEFELGEERSFVWAATGDALTGHELPKRAVIEAAARRLYEAWSAGSGVDTAETARRAHALSRMLLEPVADQLGQKRLAVVAEGALQYIPFAALPSPRRPPEVPLIATHEVVNLPSATTLAVLRQEASGRSAPGLRVAVLADPVFDRRDPRVLGGSASSGPASDVVEEALTRSMKETGLVRLERLGASRREAQAISALAGPGESFIALDFRASREAAMGAEVSSARVVHFASHGLLNGRHPELSGVVLSLVDERGHSKDGFLQARDIYKLRLSADLVVLSACQTALGKDVRGEGLLGLSRGFMYAGAPRIVASLWQVPDRATSELMKHFYEGVFQQGLRPAAALRAAQIAIRREKRWASPYYWAAFTLQGDWR